MGWLSLHPQLHTANYYCLCRLENERLSEENKRQASDGSAALATLQKKLCEAQHKADTR